VEAALPGRIGLRAELKGQRLPPEFLLFGEDASRVVISCDPARLPRIQQLSADFGLFAEVLGDTGGDRVEITIDGQQVVSASISELDESYEGALERALRSDIENVAQ
jgi:phosphoribosylformylglycinamidine synthase subunit PurL